MTFLSITIELTALDPECAANHLQKLAELIRTAPDAKEWTTSDIEGSAVAERNPDEEPS